MTLPNRTNYTPGEKRRERKYQEPEVTMGAVMAPVKPPRDESAVNAKYGPSPPNDDDALREELLQVLSGMNPDGASTAQARTAQIRTLEQHMIKLERSKTQTEAARQRLFTDGCYQQLPVKEEVMSFSALLDPSFAPSPGVQDPLEQLVANMAADTGLQPRNHLGLNRGNAAYRLDPQWASLFERAGPERQQLINGLGQLEQTSSEPDMPLEVLHDAPTRGKYQRSNSNLQEWGKQRLYQHMRASMLSRGGSIGLGTRSAPSSPIDSPFSQPPKKRANLSKHAKTVLREWFDAHLHHPYPSDDVKEWLSVQGGITIDQVNNWFINTRGRKWRPLMKKILDEKEAGGSQMYDRLVAKIEQPYAN